MPLRCNRWLRMSAPPPPTNHHHHSTRSARLPSPPTTTATGSHHHSHHSQRKPQLLAANLATLATVASVAATCTETPSAHGGSSHPPSYHRQAYHPYAKPASATTPCSSSADERDDDDASGGDTDELSLPLVPIPRPQFHPQHHHRLITATLRPSNSPNTGTGTGITSRKKMPRRKETKKIQIDIPSSEASRGIEGDPHQVFKCNGSPIISPRSIRNSLAETDFDVDGNPRPQKVATTDGGSSVITASSKTTSVVLGPVQPPTVAVAAGVVGTKEEDDNNDVDMASGVKTANRRRRVGDSNGGASSASSSRSSTPSDNGNSTGGTSEVDLLALKVEEQSLTGMSGVQLWVHRLLYTHHQTLHVLGLEREAFPNTRLSLKQLECMLSPVIALTDLMRPDHFGIHVPTPQIAQTMSDVHYWKLWESDTIDIGYERCCLVACEVAGVGVVANVLCVCWWLSLQHLLHATELAHSTAQPPGHERRHENVRHRVLLSSCYSGRSLGVTTRC